MDEALAIESVQGIIVGLVNKFCWQYPYMDKEELIAEGQIVALKAIRSYDEDRKASLQTYVYRAMSFYLASPMRWQAFKQRFAKPKNIEVMDQPAKEIFDVISLLWQVSGEAAQVIRLIVEDEMKKTELSKTLKSTLKWDSEKINRVFAEIREVLGI